MKRVVPLERAAFYATKSGGFSHFARAASSTECCFCDSRRSELSGRLRQMSAWYGLDSIGVACTALPFEAALSAVKIAQP